MRCIFAAAALLFTATATTTAQTLFWDANGTIPPDGIFGLAANWDPEQVPTAGNTAIFDINEEYTVEFDAHAASDVLQVSSGTVHLQSATATIRNYDLVTGDGDLQVNGGTLHIGDALWLDVGGQLDFGNDTASGTVIVTGTGRLNATSALPQSIGDGGHTGTLTFESGFSAQINSELNLGVSSFDASQGNLNVLSGADLTVGTLNVATDTSLATGNVTVDAFGNDFSGATLTQSGAAELNVGSPSGGAGTIDIRDEGTVNTGTGGINVYATGTINFGSSFPTGILNANGPVTVDGGMINDANDFNFNLGSGLTLRAENDAQLNFRTYFIDEGTTFEIVSGADFMVEFSLDLVDGTLLVDGVGSSVTSLAGGRWGSSVGDTDVTFRNAATGTFGTVVVAPGFAGTATATFNVESGAAVTTGDIEVHGVISDGTINVDGVGSMLTQTGASTTEVGGGADMATINLQNGGTFISGTGMILVRSVGRIDIGTGGTFNANGPVWVRGMLNLGPNGDFNLGSGLTLTAIGNGQVNYAGSHQIDNGTTFSIEFGSDFTVDGALGIASSGSGAGDGALVVGGADSTFTLTGASSLEVGHASSDTATIDIQDGGTATTGSGATTVNTTGTITIGSGGTEATFNANGPLTVHGLIDVGAGGTDGTLNANAPITVDGGTMEVSFIDGFNLDDGQTLTAINGGQINFTDGYRIDQGTTVEILSGADLTVTGRSLDISNFSNGTLVVDGPGSSVTATFNHNWGLGGIADVTFRNGAIGTLGDVYLTPSPAALAAGTAVWNLESGASVTTDSVLLIPLGGPMNSATINVHGAGSTLSVNPSSTLLVGHESDGTATLNVTGGTVSTGTTMSGVLATGTVNVGVGGTGGTFNANAPWLVDGGTFNLASGAMNAETIEITGGGSFHFTGGVLKVDTFEGDLINQGGTLAPGNTPGTTNVTGDYTQQSTGTTQIELAGTIPDTEFDQVLISGQANLDGNLDAVILNPFAPRHGQAFQVMTFASRAGVFSSVTDSGLPGSLVMAPFYTGSDLTLSVELLGDASGNGEVGVEDYLLWASGFGTAEPSYSDGDFNRNGMVEAGDYTLWANNFGSVVIGPESGPAAVPEPSAIVLFAIALLSLFVFRRERT